MPFMSAYDPTLTSRDVRFHATVKGMADPERASSERTDL